MVTLVARVTYDLVPLRCELAALPEPLRAGDIWVQAASGAKILREPADLAPMKAATDVMLVGSAYAPEGQPAREVVARLIVGEVDKSIRVTGSRALTADGTSSPAAFREAPLDWTHTAGGPDTWNPVGVLLDATGAPAPSPTVLPLDVDTPRPGDYVVPAGFGPIPLEWEPRRKRVVERAHEWLDPARIAEPFWPDAGDTRMFQAAPPDQQIARPLRSDERIVLEHLHAAHARLVTSLPGIELRAVVVDAHGVRRDLSFIADTLWIDTIRSLVTVTHRSSLPAGELLDRDVFVWLDGFEQHMQADTADLAGETLLPDDRRVAELPFRDGAAVAARLSAADEYMRLATGTIAADTGSIPARSSVPFVVPSPAAARPAAATPDAAWSPVSPLKPPALVIDTRKLHEDAQAPRPSRVDRPSVGHAADAAHQGVAAASLAAADAMPAPSTPPAAPPPAPPRVPRPSEVIELAWIEESARSALLRRFRAVLEDLDPERVPEGEVAPDDVLEILAGAPRTTRLATAAERQLALTGARFVAPTLVVSGELVFDVPLTEVLRGVHQALATIPSPGKALAEAVDAADRALRAPLVLTDESAARHLETLQTLASPGTRGGAWPIRAAVVRSAIQRRDVSKAIAFGAEHARMQLESPAERVSIYAPTACLSSLPGFERFRVVVVGELRARPSDDDVGPFVLRALAIGTVHAPPAG